MSGVVVKGEISNITYHSSGHIYFTLKDDGAVISAAFFKNSNRSCKIKLIEGMSVLALGSVSVYEKRGSYQLIVRSVMDEGIGKLQLKIEELKKKLISEGLFDPERKRQLPFLPKVIGVVTSPTGAAFRDILKVLLRRFPNINVILAPAKVQGDDAPATIVRAIEELNDPKHNIDLIIAGRGGGSFEDLLPFNDESVVRAFANSRVPIVSAVGHQIDHPISDDVADVYAPTPSAAAEICVPVKDELVDQLAVLERSLDVFLKNLLQKYRDRINSVTERRVFADPMSLIGMSQMSVDEQFSRINYLINDLLLRHKERFSRVPDLTGLVRSRMKDFTHKYLYALQALDQLSPLKTIARGYAVVNDKESNVVKSVETLRSGDDLTVYLQDGSFECRVNALHKGVTFGKKETEDQL